MIVNAFLYLSNTTDIIAGAVIVFLNGCFIIVKTKNIHKKFSNIDKIPFVIVKLIAN